MSGVCSAGSDQNYKPRKRSDSVASETSVFVKIPQLASDQECKNVENESTAEMKVNGNRPLHNTTMSVASDTSIFLNAQNDLTQVLSNLNDASDLKIESSHGVMSISYLEAHARLITAVSDGNLETIKQLMATENIDLTICDVNGYSPFTAAAAAGELGALRCISGRDGFFGGIFNFDKPSLNVVDAKGRTALDVAVIHGHIEMVQYLLAADSSFMLTTGQQAVIEHLAGGSDLYLSTAAQEGHVEVFQYIANNADLNVIFNLNDKDESGFTPATIAACQGQLEVLQHLGMDIIKENLLTTSGKHF